MAGPSNPHAPADQPTWPPSGIAGLDKWDRAEEAQGPDARWRRDHCRHHQLHQHQQPAQRDRRRLLARNANARAWCASRGSSPRWRPARKRSSCTWKKPVCWASWKSSASASSPLPAPPATACRGALDPAIQQEIIDRDLYATAVLSGNRNFDGRIHPYAKQAFLASPPLVWPTPSPARCASTSRRTCWAWCETARKSAEGHLAQRRRDRRGRRPASSRAVPPSLRFRCSSCGVTCQKTGQPAVRLAPAEHLHPPPAVLGRRAGRRAHAARHAPAGGAADNITTDHLSPSNAILLDSAAGEYLRRWACPRRTSTPTPPTAATT
jgi:hypothetical protein